MFICPILPDGLAPTTLKNLNIHELCEEYGNYVEQQMYKKKLIPNIGNYLKQINDADQNIIYVATGGETFQVRRLIKHHNLLKYVEHVLFSYNIFLLGWGHR